MLVEKKPGLERPGFFLLKTFLPGFSGAFRDRAFRPHVHGLKMASGFIFLGEYHHFCPIVPKYLLALLKYWSEYILFKHGSCGSFAPCCQGDPAYRNSGFFREASAKPARQLARFSCAENHAIACAATATQHFVAFRKKPA